MNGSVATTHNNCVGIFVTRNARYSTWKLRLAHDTHRFGINCAQSGAVPSTMNINLLPVSKTIPDIAQWEWRSFSRPERLSKSTICISPVAKPQAIARPSDRKLMTEGQAHSVSISKMKRWVFMSNRARRLRLPPIHNRRLMHEHPVRLNVVYKTGT